MAIDNGMDKDRITIYFGNEPSEEYNVDTHWNAAGEQNTALPSRKVTQLKQLAQNKLTYDFARSTYRGVVDRVAAYTGDYITGNKLNNIATVADGIVAIASGNGLAFAIQAGLQMADYAVKVGQADMRAETLRNLVGLTSTNRSRSSGGKL